MKAERILAFALLLASVACKPTEANYKAAYDKAIAGKEAAVSDDATIYNAVRREMNMGEITVGGVPYPINSQYVAITPDGGGINEYLRKYMVVAGQFKQVFNAKMMRQRLTECGYPGAFVVQTREPYYFVIAASFSELPKAIATYQKLKDDEGLKIKSPLPFFLCPSQIR